MISQNSSALSSLPKVILLYGQPGSGKGTQAKKLSKQFGIPHISTGTIFRKQIEKDSLLGKEIKNLINQGKSVPKEIVFKILQKRLSKEDCKNGYILEGSGSKKEHVEFFLDLMQSISDIQSVYLDVKKENLLDRLKGRLSCNQCFRSYHEWLMPARKEDICNKCQVKLIKRSDDASETIERRLEDSEKDLKEIQELLRARNLLYVVDGNNEKKVVFSDILACLKERLPNV